MEVAPNEAVIVKFFMLFRDFAMLLIVMALVPSLILITLNSIGAQEAVRPSGASSVNFPKSFCPWELDKAQSYQEETGRKPIFASCQ